MKNAAVLYLIFAVFESIMANQLKWISSGNYFAFSNFERKLSSNTLLGALFPAIMVIARFGAIAFLFYLGYKYEWYNPILLYIGGIALNVVLINIFKIDSMKTQLITMAGLFCLPLLFASMWYIAITSY